MEHTQGTSPSRGSFAIVPDGPFSLREAANFGFGPQMARPKPIADTMAMAFVLDGYTSHAAVFATQHEQVVQADVYGDLDVDIQAVRRQVERVLSLNHSGAAWSQVGAGDPVIDRLQARYHGLRPVLFYSPYEAAA